MNSVLRPLILIGTRPEAIKLAPVVRECRGRGEGIRPIVCLSGQHRELVAPLVEYFDLAPDESLELMRPGQSLAALTAGALHAIDDALARHSPDCVVVQGDTTTVLAAAQAAFFRRIPLVHVEAGLRTGRLDAPWPEEFNRRVAGIVAALHCCPTQRAAAALIAEGVPGEQVHLTGNTVVDALLETVARERSRGDHWKRVCDWLGERRLVLITGHRRESLLGDGLAEICKAIVELSGLFPDVEFVYPVHLNPGVREPVHRLLSGRNNVRLLPPVDYPQFVWLMDRSALILTDSGGVQEEAPSLGKHVLVMREATERPEAIRAGAATLVGTKAERIVAEATRRLDRGLGEASCAVGSEAELGDQPAAAIANPFGDGQAAKRIVDLMLARFGGPEVGRVSQ